MRMPYRPHGVVRHYFLINGLTGGEMMCQSKVIVHHIVVILLIVEIVIRLTITSGIPIVIAAVMTAVMIITAIILVLTGKIPVRIIPHEYIQVIQLFGIVEIINRVVTDRCVRAVSRGYSLIGNVI